MANSELEQAYEEMDQIVRKITVLEGVEGLVTDWVGAAAIQKFDDDGDSLSMVGLILPGGGGSIPLYRVKGLLVQALDNVSAPECECGE